MANVQKMTASEFMGRSGGEVPQGRCPAIHHAKKRMEAGDTAENGPEVEAPDEDMPAEQNSRRGRAKRLSKEESKEATKPAGDETKVEAGDRAEAKQHSRRGKARRMSADEAKAGDEPMDAKKAEGKKAEEAEKHSKRGPRRRMQADASEEPKSEDGPKSPSMMKPASAAQPQAGQSEVAKQFAANTKQVVMGPGNVAMTNNRFSSSKLK